MMARPDASSVALFTAHHLHHEDKILPLLYECAVEPHFIGFADNLLSLGYLAEIIETFGWERSSELVFNLSAKLLGRRRGEPERFRRDAVGLMTSIVPVDRSDEPGYKQRDRVRRRCASSAHC